MITVVLIGLHACSSDGSAESGAASGAYARVIRWFTERTAADESPVVFVEVLGEGVTIDLEVQAAIIEATQSFADVRFIDDRSEAFESGTVRDGGILLAVGPAVPDHNSMSIDCSEVLTDTTSVDRHFELRFQASEWVLAGAPTEVST